MIVSGQGVKHTRLGCSTYQNMRELDLGEDSIKNLWPCLFGTEAPTRICKELGAVMGPTILDYRNHLTGIHLTL